MYATGVREGVLRSKCSTKHKLKTTETPVNNQDLLFCVIFPDLSFLIQLRSLKPIEIIPILRSITGR